MNLKEVLEKTEKIVPRKINASGKTPESFSPREIEEVSLAAIRMAIGSVIPEAEVLHVGGQKFPDITVVQDGETNGIEIKSTRTAVNPWTVPGGSIREGNRVDSVKDVWLLFTKLAEKVETRTRPYDEAVCDLAVTHSPRYILSMESTTEESLFVKLGISYEEVRKSDNPFKFFRAYLEKKARDSGGMPWWCEMEPEATSPAFIRFWEDLEKEEEEELLVEGWAMFAKDFLFGTGRDKYKGFALHLVRRHAIITTSLRDKFTAGGQKLLIKEFGHSPASFARFALLLKRVRKMVQAGGVENCRSWSDWKEQLLNSARKDADLSLLEAIFREYS